MMMDKQEITKRIQDLTTLYKAYIMLKDTAQPDAAKTVLKTIMRLIEQ